MCRGWRHDLASLPVSCSRKQLAMPCQKQVGRIEGIPEAARDIAKFGCTASTWLNSRSVTT